MTNYPIFLSLVMVVRDQASALPSMLADATRFLGDLVSDYELIIVDNASTDESISVLKKLTYENGLPNLQIYALTKEVDTDTAFWVGLENALGDFVAVLDPLTDNISFLPAMLDRATSGADIVLAANKQRPPRSLAYKISSSIFDATYKWFTGIRLSREAPRYRLLSKRVVNFILQHPQPAIVYRHLPASGGFARANLSYSAAPKIADIKGMGNGFDRGMRLLVSTTRTPLRLVTALSLFGAVSNLIYSGYVIIVALFKTDVAPGWVTLSMQQSGMFFLISLVLLVLGEYILQVARLSNEGPLYHVAQEFTSAVIKRREKLNIETAPSAQAESIRIVKS